jgi:hypothetical protein
VLLSDLHLQQCLARKTRWRLDNLNAQIISRTIPHFGQSVHHPDLRDSWYCDDIPNIFRLLTCFPILRFLRVQTSRRMHIHFDNLPPSLRKLFYHEPHPSRCNCKNNLPNLESLFFNVSRGSVELPRILPFKSKTTLRELHFRMEDAPSDGEVLGFSLLHQFENRTALGTVRWIRSYGNLSVSFAKSSSIDNI